jgi:hypothetical protein
MVPPKGETEVGIVKLIGGKLAQLQPKPQAPALHNQLRSAQMAAEAKQEERAKVLVVKERQQAQVEELQMSIAKMDRTMGKMDAEIVELNQTVGKLLEEVKSNSAASVPQAQPSAVPEDLPDPAFLQQVLQWYGIADTPEQVLANLKQEPTGSTPTATTTTSSPTSPPMPAERGEADKEAEAKQTEKQTETQTEVPIASAPAVDSNRGSTAASAGRRKIKEIPTPTLDQKAATGRAVAGLERQERLRAARARGVPESGDTEEDEAIKLRIEEEMDQQAMP